MYRETVIQRWHRDHGVGVKIEKGKQKQRPKERGERE